MKNLGTCLFFVVLVSLFCLAIPGNALAQSGGDLPCCFIAPTGMSPVMDNGIQSAVSITPGSRIELSPGTGLELPRFGQFAAEFEIPGLYVMRDREFYRGNLA